ncbi:hypothetical protein HZA33_00805 [Candidatus Pacearchaeota archaeon]|nr:hypothetical protein [Candidatus Pacearchaeota archaeon]
MTGNIANLVTGIEIGTLTGTVLASTGFIGYTGVGLLHKVATGVQIKAKDVLDTFYEFLLPGALLFGGAVTYYAIKGIESCFN